MNFKKVSLFFSQNLRSPSVKNFNTQKAGTSFGLGYESNCREEKITARKNNNNKKKNERNLDRWHCLLSPKAPERFNVQESHSS